MRFVKLALISIGINIYSAVGQSVKFSLEDTQSKLYTYNQLQGKKLTVIDFWASWCKPCMQSIPHLVKLFGEFKDQGVNFIGISVDGPRSVSKVAPLAESLSIPYPVLLDFNNDVMRQLNINGVPALVIVNQKNKVVYFHDGYVAGDENIIKEKILAFLAQ